MKIAKHTGFIPAVYILAGLFYLFEPFLSSWFEIVNPLIARFFFLPIDWTLFVVTLLLPGDLGFYFPDIAFGLATLFYLAFFVKIIGADWADKEKRFAFAPLVIFPLIWVLMSPLGLSYNGLKRGNSLVVGGWSRMILAGGADQIRVDGYTLLRSPNEYPADGEIPPSIRELGSWVEIEQDNKILLVGVEGVVGMDDEFGYIIYDKDKSLPLACYLAASEYYRIWKFADGVYFFER
ncbi:MAG TPA: hypothetical protein VLZ89_08130 [Anaerolineales bacterium]|nr:hypothetical protein [Anaerolineales bacterium]